MSTRNSFVVGIAVARLVAACASTEYGTDTAPVGADWFHNHLPPGSDLEHSVLSLVNTQAKGDSILDREFYEFNVGISHQAAEALVDFRDTHDADLQPFKTLSPILTRCPARIPPSSRRSSSSSIATSTTATRVAVHAAARQPTARRFLRRPVTSS
jgi:hypothetical protein